MAQVSGESLRFSGQVTQFTPPSKSKSSGHEDFCRESCGIKLWPLSSTACELYIQHLCYSEQARFGNGGGVKLPEDVAIPEDKLLRYLLLPREEHDKSQFLAIAGYALATWETLKRDLRELARTQEISDVAISP
jgi:hypothetical protein